MKANVAQKDVDIQRTTTQFNQTVPESNKMKTAYETHIAEITEKYTELSQKKYNDDISWNDLHDKHEKLKAELAASKGGAVAAPASVPAVYTPILPAVTPGPAPAAQNIQPLAAMKNRWFGGWGSKHNPTLVV